MMAHRAGMLVLSRSSTA